MRLSYNYKTLEFDLILEEISKNAFSQSAQRIINALKPLSSTEAVETYQHTILECMDIIIRSGSLPFLMDYDIHEIIQYIKQERSLRVTDIQYLRLFLIMIKAIKEREKNFLKENIKLNYLTPYMDNLDPLLHIISEIDLTIDPDGYVLDSASENLYKLRKEIKRSEQKRKDLLQSLLSKRASILNESMLVMRNGVYTLPVKTEFKNQVKGVIQDVSSSGTTTYIEPQEAVNMSVLLKRLTFEEGEEIKQILDDLSSRIYPEKELFSINLENIIALDVFQSIALYSIKYNCHKPKLNNEGNVDLIDARHPLIPQDEVIPIHIKLSTIKPILMITGPNTGGKTVALKTLGLLSIMAQSGLLIPVSDKSTISLFSGVYADIGDKQSIVQSLSTFSSHILNIKNILDDVKPGALLLFDELGSGTDPVEGVALAKAIIDHLLTMDIRMIITTHYSELKLYAYQNPRIENASVKFDELSLKPQYIIEYGRSGSSNALKIASRLGLHDEVIHNAFEYTKDKETDLSEAIKNFESKVLELEDLMDEQKVIQKHLQEKESLLEQKLGSLEHDKQKILIDYKQKQDALIKKTEKEASAILAMLKESKAPHEIAELKFELSKLGIVEEEISNEELKVGDYVYINSYDQIGQITSKKRNRFIVKFGHFELEFKPGELSKRKKPVSQTEEIKKSIITTDEIKLDASYELDLRGYRYEEVKEAYLKFIDNAILAGLKELRIIHGFGTGAVRKALYSLLKDDKHIASYRFGGEFEGQNGVTIVSLK